MLLQGYSGTTPETSRNTPGTNQGTNEHEPQCNPHPKMSISQSQNRRNFRPDCDCDMVTGDQEEITYCSPGTSSSKQKETCSTSQPHFHTQNTPATIEANKSLLAHQQLANDTNSANLNDNIHRSSKLPESLTTTMPAFDNKPERCELMDDFFQTSLKKHIQLTEDDEIN